MSSSSVTARGDVVERIWERLGDVREVRFRAHWRDGFGVVRAGEGRGSVTVIGGGPGAEGELLLEEEGVWEPAPGTRLAFRGRYRWRRLPDGLGLAHVRRGRERPVFLVELVSGGDGELRSRAPHLCGGDRYGARVEGTSAGVRLVWRVRGPEKAQRLESTYR